jgi:hypothetical protein
MSKFGAMALAVDQPARLYLLHPKTGRRITDADGNDPAWIDVYSSDSLAMQDIQRRLLDKRRAAKGALPTPEETDAEAAEICAALTAGWNLRGLDGAKLDLPFSRDDAEEFYALRACRWVRDQVDAFAAARGNFART